MPKLKIDPKVEASIQRAKKIARKKLGKLHGVTNGVRVIETISEDDNNYIVIDGKRIEVHEDVFDLFLNLVIENRTLNKKLFNLNRDIGFMTVRETNGKNIQMQ